jgi:quercetin dioxygenase-like cupin family protein
MHNVSRRSAEFQRFLSSAEAAIRHAAGADKRITAAAARIFSALQTPATQAEPLATARLPVCRHLPAALERACSSPGHVGDLANAFAAIEPQLRWKTRAGAETHGEHFLNSHASANIAGAEGIETRADVWIGVSLMAPGTRYPDHRHPPEEIYVVLSDGEWCNTDTPWHAPGIGNLVYNPPNIVHAMRSAQQPLLALWFLPTGATP